MPEHGVLDPVTGKREGRQVAALQLVLALRTRLHAWQPACDGFFQHAVVAQLKVEVLRAGQPRSSQVRRGG